MHSDSGDYKAALSKLLEARDVTTSLADKMDLALTIVVTSVNGDLWQNVRPEFAKASALKGRFKDVALWRLSNLKRVRSCRFGTVRPHSGHHEMRRWRHDVQICTVL